MRYDTQAIDGFVDEVKGAARLISRFFTTPVNFIFVAIVLGALIAVNLLVN
jgi:hypothetical protein